MTKWKVTFNSMTAFYELGYVYADTEEEALREARTKATAFPEKSLIRVRPV